MRLSWLFQINTIQLIVLCFVTWLIRGGVLCKYWDVCADTLKLFTMFVIKENHILCSKNILSLDFL